jgi:hypothetical protein
MAPKYSANPLKAALSTARNGERSARQRRGTTPFEKSLASQFGLELAPSIHLQASTFRAAVAQGKAQTQAGKQQLAAGAQTISDMTSIFKQSASQQAAAAAVAKARAVQAATGASDDATAQFAQSLMMAQLDSERRISEQKEMMKFQMNLENKAAAQAGRTSYAPAIQAIGTQAPSLAVGVADAVRVAIEGNGGTTEGLDIGSTAASIVQSIGYTGEEPEGALAFDMVRNMLMGGRMTAGDAFKGALMKQYGSMPGFEKWGESIAESAIDSARVAVQARWLAITKDDDTAARASMDAWAVGGIGTPQQRLAAASSSAYNPAG